jgi:MFS family permease
VQLATRFLWGALNGNIGVGKTWLAENCDDSNQATAFLTIGISGGAARFAGPAIGGYLAHPATKFHQFKYKLFESYPYVLPCFVAGFVALIGTIAVVCFVHETLGTAKRGPSQSMKRRRRKSITTEYSQLQPGLDEEGEGGGGGDGGVANRPREASGGENGKDDEGVSGGAGGGAGESSLWRDTLVLKACLLYGMNGCFNLVTDEVGVLF